MIKWSSDVVSNWKQESKLHSYSAWPEKLLDDHANALKMNMNHQTWWDLSYLMIEISDTTLTYKLLVWPWQTGTICFLSLPHQPGKPCSACSANWHSHCSFGNFGSCCDGRSTRTALDAQSPSQSGFLIFQTSHDHPVVLRACPGCWPLMPQPWPCQWPYWGMEWTAVNVQEPEEERKKLYSAHKARPKPRCLCYIWIWKGSLGGYRILPFSEIASWTGGGIY